MATIETLKPTFLQLTQSEQEALILCLRANRRISKRAIVREEKKSVAEKKTKAKKTESAVNKLTPEQAAKLLALLAGEA